MSSKTMIMEFDQRQFGKHPPLGSLILHILGFATIQIVGFDPKETRHGDLAIGIALF
jgi:hypothetical protein